MEESLPDPSDFQPTPLVSLVSLDAALRCQVCKDFLTNAVITSCSHTFCSLCIRRCLAAEGRCPTCRAQEQEARLRRNGAAQEIVDIFTKSRDDLLSAGRELAQIRESGAQDAHLSYRRQSKRKRADVEDDEYVDEEPAHQAPRTRSQHRSTPLRNTPNGGPHRSTKSRTRPHETAEIPDSDEDAMSEQAEQQEDQTHQDDGLVPCPICTKRMKPELVFGHLDICTGSSNNTSKFDQQRRNSSTDRKAQPPHKPPPERLPHLSYSLLKEAALRSKLSSLGINSSGPKPLLIRRHTEWVSIWNANCDSDNPKPRRDLLRELDKWERTQGGLAPERREAANGIMEKDFDGEGWGKNHRGHFGDLVALAKKGIGKKEENEQAQEKLEPNGEDRKAEDCTQNKPEISAADEESSYVPSSSQQNQDHDSANLKNTSSQSYNPRSQIPSSDPVLASDESFLYESRHSNRTRKKPMFEVPSEPVVDSEMEHTK